MELVCCSCRGKCETHRCAPASRTNSTAQMHVPVWKNVSTVTTINSAMMHEDDASSEEEDDL